MENILESEVCAMAQNRNEDHKMSDFGVQMVFLGAAAVLSAGVLMIKEASEGLKREYQPASYMRTTVLTPSGCGECRIRISEPR